MAVKPGYKLTEVGVIPEDWERMPLEKLSAFITKGSTPTTHGFRWEPSGILFLRSECVSDDGLDLTQSMFISAHAHQMLRRSEVCGGDILMTITGNVGRVVYFLDIETANINQHIARIRISSSSVDSGYIYHYLSQPAIRVYFGSITTGQAYPQISLRQVRNVQIPLPPLPEQHAIATALSDVDALISSLDALISKKKQIKQGAMQELLSGKRRLPGFSGEWEVVTLFKLAEGKKEYFNDGDWIESEHITTDGIRFIQTGNIGVGYFIEKHDRKYISEKSFTSLSCKEINLGDLLICRLADPAGRACVLPDIGESKVVTSVDVTIFRAPPSSANRVYLALLFSTSDWFKSISDRSGGTTHKRIARGALGKISITLPPLPEQQAIATILSDMDAEITALESRRKKTRALKQGMMQELLTGRIRLIHPAAHAVSA
ncbi:MAG: restriction endonuclease subunit S [Acidithiobacillus sp.]